MNKLINSAMKFGVGAALVVLVSSNSFGQFSGLLYNNTANPTGAVYNQPAGIEFGDQINFSPVAAGGSYTVQNLSFETFGSGLGDENNSQALVTVRIYDADTSTTLLGLGNLRVQSTQFVVADGFQTHSLDIPGDYTVGDSGSIFWTVEFDKIPGGGQVGLTLNDPPTIGSSLNDFAQLTDLQNPAFPFRRFQDGSSANFTASVTGTAVPEPGTAALALIGGAALLGLRRRR